MTFNIGDRVRVRGQVPVAHRLLHKVGTVFERDSTGNYPYAVYFESDEHEIFREDELTLEPLPAARRKHPRKPREPTL